MKFLRYCLAALSISAFTAASVSAEPVSVSTNPVGYVTVEMSAGGNIFSVPLLNSPDFTGTVLDSESNVVFFDSLPELASSSFLQILSGAYAGTVISILDANSDNLVLEDNFPVDAVGDTIAVREHYTLGQLSDVANFSNGDVVTFYELGGGVTVAEYFDGFGWYSEEEDELFNSAILFPGEAVVFSLINPISINVIGEVSSHPISVSITPGLNLIGGVNPVNGETFSALAPVDDSSASFIVTVYANISGRLRTTAVYEYFEGFGFYDEENDIIVDDEHFPAGWGVAVNTNTANKITLDSPLSD